MPSFDAIVIGTGQAGPFLATRLAAAGMRVAVVERGAFGGTCVNTGCIPTKTLIASAAAAEAIRRAGELGIAAGGPLQGGHEGHQGAQGPDLRRVAREHRDVDAEPSERQASTPVTPASSPRNRSGSAMRS